MTTTLLILLLLALSLSCWLATLKISLDEASRSRIERQLSGGNDDDSVDLLSLIHISEPTRPY